MSGVCAIWGDIRPMIWTLTPVRLFGPVGVIENLQFDPPGTVSVLGETVRVNFVPAHSARTVLVCAAPDPVSAPVTANHLSSEPESTKTIGATQLPGKLTIVLMSESPLRVAGNPLVMLLTVETLACPSSVRQLTRARNDVSSLMPRNSGGTWGSLVKTSPRTEMLRWPSVVSEPVALVSIHGNSSPRTPRMSVCPTKPSSTPYIVPHERMSPRRLTTARSPSALGLRSGGGGCFARTGWRLKITAALKITSFILFITAPFLCSSRVRLAHPPG